MRPWLPLCCLLAQACALVTTADRDQDGDGEESTDFGGADCNDLDPTVAWRADADGDGIPNCVDCDDADPSVHQAPRWYADGDGDGWGQAGDTLVQCDAPAGYAPLDGDCDDTNETINPGALEILADGVDQDCSGGSDLDGDGDGHDSLAFDGDDCDDADPLVSPSAGERCATPYDDDCDGDANDVDADGCTLWYPDADIDGYGVAPGTCTCTPATGEIATGGDCDDDDGDANPGRTEVCRNGKDDNCDGEPAPCIRDLTVDETDVKFSNSDAKNSGFWFGAGAGDVNADGFDDLVVTRSGGEAYVILGGASATSMPLELAADVVLATDRQGFDGAGDVNADGYDDILVTGAGGDATAWLVLGAASPASVSMSTAIPFLGEAPADYSRTVAGAGDVDGDGHDDMLVGVVNPAGVMTSAGAVYLALGSDAPGTTDLATVPKFSGEAGDFACFAASVGDVDGDGLADILIGALGHAGGTAYLILGAPSLASMPLSSADAVFTDETDGDEAGYGLDGAGDFNADGYADLVIGAPARRDQRGAAFLVLGSVAPADRPLSEANAAYNGVEPGDQAGMSVAGAGDFDGDGFADLIIGAPGAKMFGDSVGSAYLVLGSTAPGSGWLGVAEAPTPDVAGDADARITGIGGSGFGAGMTVAGIGDFNADGYDDLFVDDGTYNNSSGSTGAAFLVFGNGP